MKVSGNHIIEKLKDRRLKVTPQRIAVLEAVYALDSHPSTEKIIEYIKKTYPNIAIGTVYKVLDVLVENQLIHRVKTEKDIMRYDGMLENHHHLYSSESDRIEDFIDEELDDLLDEYFMNKGIPGFEIEDIKLHIKGKFKETL
ncbi:MAG TPA: transcriptional repressor [Candidatus Marinimicrobia bacterium]|mgnify:CR=1 FL=1|nr:transcriptional repressor [Candidatus Neomarinimicrobiota bacterium]